MPLLQRVTLTGADNSTSIERLIELSKSYPFVEWGVLFSRSQVGKGRYPTFEWIREFSKAFDLNHRKPRTAYNDMSKPSFALHICGAGVMDYLEHGCLEEVDTKKFIRIQLNFNYRQRDEITINSLTNRFVMSNKLYITQHNQSNHMVAGNISEPNHMLLFDASGGRGASPTSWPAPLLHRECGWAGGLGPDNLPLDQIDGLAKMPYWIDMEGKLRTDDKFDLDKCEEVLKKVAASGYLIKSL